VTDAPIFRSEAVAAVLVAVPVAAVVSVAPVAAGSAAGGVAVAADVVGIEVDGIEVDGIEVDGIDGDVEDGGAALAPTPTPAVWAMAGAAIRPAMAQAAKSEVLILGLLPGNPPQAAQPPVATLVPS
jgi:hypothetical protein